MTVPLPSGNIGKLRAQQARTVILASDDLADLHELLARLVNGDSLTAAETGVADEEPITDATLLSPPTFLFDGFRWSAWLVVST